MRRATVAANAPLGAARAGTLFPFAHRKPTSLFASLASRCRTRFVREQRGVSLVETVLAVGILGLALTATLNAFSALAQSAGHLDRATAADAVATSVAESILNQPYASSPGTYSTLADVANPRAYAIAVQIEYASNPAGVDQATPPTWTTAPPADYGLQRITITVTPAQGGSARVARVLKRR